MLLRHICEVCDKEEILTPEEAFDAGWDYPPKMGSFGVISGRYCGDCLIKDTLWWTLAIDKKTIDELTPRQKETMNRILTEPESILVTH